MGEGGERTITGARVIRADGSVEEARVVAEHMTRAPTDDAKRSGRRLALAYKSAAFQHGYIRCAEAAAMADVLRLNPLPDWYQAEEERERDALLAAWDAMVGALAWYANPDIYQDWTYLNAAASDPLLLVTAQRDSGERARAALAAVAKIEPPALPAKEEG